MFDHTHGEGQGISFMLELINFTNLDEQVIPLSQIEVSLSFDIVFTLHSFSILISCKLAHVTSKETAKASPWSVTGGCPRRMDGNVDIMENC